MRIEVREEAENDLRNGIEFHERQAGGLGRYFLDSMLSEIELLHLYAGIHATHYGYHRMIARHFPTAIYYRVEEDVVRDHAVIDCRRDPRWIRDRLTQTADTLKPPEMP
ncbi:MAG: type II toxin-antitoxin system RelE/ParE family toxin [Candidatus Hydrogenedentes bacterium]|nr:type II toxin-antitoxin system RelE/ParE family toxin [Candidatus Hydrogenedentota bacterium]